MAKRKPRGCAYPWIAAGLRPLAEPLDAAQLDPGNSNRHPPESIAAIAASIRQFGQRTPIVVNRKTKHIAKGNGTWLAMQQLRGQYPKKYTHAAILWVEDSASDHAGYSVADNRTAQLAKWDQERLLAQIAEMQAGTPDLADALLLAELLPPGQLGAGPDAPAVEVPAVWAVQIEVASESEQKTLFDRMKREGFKVKVLTL
jgi:hypothetical protein